MGKKNKKKRDALTSSSYCQPPNYCEYYYGPNGWTLAADDSPPGYYCPSSISIPGSPGDRECEPAYPDPPSSFVGAGASQLGNERRKKSKCECGAGGGPQKSRLPFCEYEFRHGEFYFIGGECQPGWYCPPDPIEYAKQNGPVQMVWAYENGRVIARMMPVPMV